MRTSFPHSPIFPLRPFDGAEGVAQNAKKEAEAETQYPAPTCYLTAAITPRLLPRRRLPQTPLNIQRSLRGYGLGLCFSTRKYQEAATLLGELAKQPNAPDAARLNLFRGQALLMLKQYAVAEAFGAGIKALPANADKVLQQNLRSAN